MLRGLNESEMVPKFDNEMCVMIFSYFSVLAHSAVVYVVVHTITFIIV